MQDETTSIDTKEKGGEATEDRADDSGGKIGTAEDPPGESKTNQDTFTDPEEDSIMVAEENDEDHSQTSEQSRQSYRSVHSKHSKQSNLRIGFDDPPHDAVNDEQSYEDERAEEDSEHIEVRDSNTGFKESDDEELEEPPTLHEAIDQVELDPSAEVDPFAPVQVLNLPTRLENLLYNTEAQAGALLREMDAIREDREKDRATIRDKARRVNELVEKTNALDKKNRKLLRTLHNRSAPLPTVAQILQAQNLSQYERGFAKKKIHSAMLIAMNDNDLWQAVGMKRGHRRRLMAAVKKFLVGPKMPALPTPLPTPAPSVPSTARYSDMGDGLDGLEQDRSESAGARTDRSDEDSGSSSGSESEATGSDGTGMGSASDDEEVEGENDEGHEVAIDMEQ